MDGADTVSDPSHPELGVTVRYTAADGSDRTLRFVRMFPVHDLPRRGQRATVRHHPDDPTDALSELDTDPA
ncbi:hypothetical protein [Kitasatospora sp. NPDC051914]|uniref:hypothetical protein n=1 Tax=Kitasatospora sp. NPDC051914 TaxID=3154945 RepID=UPI00342FFBDE